MSEEHIYVVLPSVRYKRTRKLAKKRGLDMDILDWDIDQLARDIPLPNIVNALSHNEYLCTMTQPTFSFEIAVSAKP